MPKPTMSLLMCVVAQAIIASAGASCGGEDSSQEKRADWPPRTTLEELESMIQAGKYHLIRQQKVAHRIESTGVVHSLGKGHPDWVLVDLPGTHWMAHLHGVRVDHGLQPGDRVKFAGLIVAEAYSALTVWVEDCDKLPLNEAIAVDPRGSSLPDGDQATKIDGRIAGFDSLHDPIGSWQAASPEHRWTGKLADGLKWNDIERIHVLGLHIAVRGKGDVESFIRGVIEGAELVTQRPANVSSTVKSDKGQLYFVRALLELHDGDSVLLSMGSAGAATWLIVEHPDRGIGLAIKQRR